MNRFPEENKKVNFYLILMAEHLSAVKAKGFDYPILFHNFRGLTIIEKSAYNLEPQIDNCVGLLFEVLDPQLYLYQTHLSPILRTVIKNKYYDISYKSVFICVIMITC